MRDFVCEAKNWMKLKLYFIQLSGIESDYLIH